MKLTRELIVSGLLLVFFLNIVFLLIQGISRADIIPGVEVPNELHQENEKRIETHRVTRVIDGDTIEIDSGQKIRYIGIDAPESVDPRRSVQCYGREASEKNRELTEGREIRLEKDVSETDSFGRLLRYVYLADTGEMVNKLLVREGYARASSYPPDVRYQEEFNELENEAMSNKRGLWSEKCK